MDEIPRPAPDASDSATGTQAPPDGRAVAADRTATAGGLERLDQRAVTLWRLMALGQGALATAAVFGAEWVFEPPLPFGLATTAAALLAVLWAAFVPPLQYEAWGYRVRDNDVYIRRGVIFRTTSLLPHSRIQHVDTRHGPIDRWLGLAEVVVYTAGTRGARVSIPALEAEEAERVRDRLAALSGTGDAV